VRDDLTAEKSAYSVGITRSLVRTLHQKLLTRLQGAEEKRALIFGRTWVLRTFSAAQPERELP
jgi:hypothetical protein